VANTVILLKYSGVTEKPTSLNTAEPAYSDVTDVLWIGDNTGVVAIGGKAYTQIVDARTANNTSNTLVLRNTSGNFAANVITANLTGRFTNARNIALSGKVTGNADFDGSQNITITTELLDTAVTPGSYGSTTKIPTFSVDVDGRLTYAANVDVATTFSYAADNGTGSLSLLTDSFIIKGGDGISSVGVDANNTVILDVDSTVVKTDRSSQTINGDIAITGNLIVSGNTITQDVETIRTEDSLIQLANNNLGDALDIGFYGQYTNSGTKYAGLIRDASDGNFKLFVGETTDPTSNVVSYGAENRATLETNITGGNVHTLYSAVLTTDGGTGIRTYATGDFIYASGTDTLSKLTKPSVPSILSMDSSGVPTWVDTLSVAEGGTGNTTFTSNQVVIGNGTSALSTLVSSTQGHILQVNGSGQASYGHLNGNTTIIQLKRYPDYGVIPAAANLSYGELALNYNDGKLYYKNADGTTVKMVKTEADPGGNTTEVQFNTNSDFDGSSNFTYTKATDTLNILNLNVSNNAEAEHIIVHDKLYAGIATQSATPLPNLIAQFTSNSSTYTQVNQQNISPNGSADFVITADVGDDEKFYTDLGMAGSQYNFYEGYETPFEPLTGYFLVQGNTGQVGGNMIIGTTTPSTNIRFLVGGFENANVILNLDESGLDIVRGELTSATTTRIFNVANAAFGQANAAFGQSNNSFGVANSGFAQANNAFGHANNSYNRANSGFYQANIAYDSANSGFYQANIAYAHANAAFDAANSKLIFSNISANGTTLAADGGGDTLTITAATSNGIFINANSATDSFDIGLLVTGVSAGYYGAADKIATFNVGTDGRIISASNVQIDVATAQKAYNQANSAFDAANTANSFNRANTGASIIQTTLAYQANVGAGRIADTLAYQANVGAGDIVVTNAYQANVGSARIADSAAAQANTGAALISAKSYTDTANTDLKNYTDVLVSTANTNLKNYTDVTVSTANTNLKNYADVTVSTANTNLKNYVDTANTDLKNYADVTVSTANTNLKNYTDVLVSTANTNLKNYTDVTVSTANTNLKNYTDVVVSTANTNLKNYVDVGVATGQANVGSSFIATTLAYQANVGATRIATFNHADNAYNKANVGGDFSGFVNVASNVRVGSYIDLNTAPSKPTNVEGRLFYDNDQKALSYYNESNMTLQIGQESVVRVWNNTGSTISDGKAVYINGSSSSNGFPSIALANSAIYDSSEVIGLTTTVIPHTGYGYVTSSGKVNGLDTHLITEGEEIYLSATDPGGWTTTPAASPAAPVRLGIVSNSDLTDGSVLVDITFREGVNKTTGAILFAFDDTIHEDPSNLYYDHTNHRLGIGTNLPTANLHVAGDALFTGNVQIQGNLIISNAQSISTTTLAVGGNLIVMNDTTVGTPVSNAEIRVNRGSSANVYIKWDETQEEWIMYEGTYNSGHILHSEKTAHTWAEYTAMPTYEKLTHPIGADLANSINEIAKTAFNQANTGLGIAVAGFGQANLAYDAANTAVTTGQANVGAGLIATTSAYQANVGAGLITAKSTSEANVGAGLITTTSAYQANVGAGLITAKSTWEANVGVEVAAREANVGAGLITTTSAYQANVGAGLITEVAARQANVGAGLITTTLGYQANVGAVNIGLNSEITNRQANVGAGLITTTSAYQANVGAGLIAAKSTSEANVGAARIAVTNAYQANVGAVNIALNSEITNRQANVGAGLITITSAYQANVGAGLITYQSTSQANAGAGDIAVTNAYQANVGAVNIAKVNKSGDVMSGTLQAEAFISNTSISVGGTNYAALSSNTFTTSSTSQVSVDSFSTSTYRGAKYFAQMTSGSSYHIIELNVVHDGTTVYLAQYGEIFTGSSLGTFNASITSGVLNLLFTATNSTTTVKLMRTSIVV